VKNGAAVANAAARPRLSWKVAAVRIGGSALLLAVLFRFLPLDELWAAIQRIPLVLWAGAIAIYMTFHLLGVVKWRMLVNAAGAGLGPVQAVRAYYIGLFSNTFLPSVVGGDVIRAGVALKHVRSPAGLLLGSLVDRVQDVLGLAGLAALGALLLPTALDQRSRDVFMLLFGLMAAGTALLIIVLRLVPGRRLPIRLRRIAVRVRAAYRALADRPGDLAGAFVLGMALQTLQVVLNVWLGSMVGLTAPFQVWLFVWPLAKIAATLPLTQGGIGIREAALAALFAPFGVPAVLAVAVSLVFQVVVISGGLAGGIVSVVLGRAAPTARGNGGIVSEPHVHAVAVDAETA
jgi:uncharacterized membrane protein YbhN (UPF0104 family)